MTDVLRSPETVLADLLESHVRRLAKIELNLSLSDLSMNDWTVITSDILDAAKALRGAAQSKDVALWMMAHSYATGHGDTLDDLLGELVHQVHTNALLEAHKSAQPPDITPAGAATEDKL